MDKKTFKKTSKIIFLIIVAQIVLVFAISLMPFFYETISADNPEFWLVSPPISKAEALNNPSNQSLIKTRIHYNFFTMQKRDDENIQKISGDLKEISYLIWGSLILGTISFIGFILFSTEKFPERSFLIMSIGSGIIFLSVFSLYKQFMFIDTVNSIKSVDLSAIWKPNSNLYYIYILFLASIVTVFGSVVYTGRIGMIFYNRRKEFKKNQALKRMLSKDESPDEGSTRIKREEGKPFFGDSKVDEKNLEKNKVDEIIEENDIVLDKDSEYHGEKNLEKKTDNAEIDERESFFGENGDNVQVGQKDVFDESKSKESNDAFDSEYSEEKAVSYKEVRVRCPKCKHVFKIKKKIGEPTHMFCPQCGQKGVLK